MPGFIGDPFYYIANPRNFSIYVGTPLYFKGYKPDVWLAVPSRYYIRSKTVLSLFSYSVQ